MNDLTNIVFEAAVVKRLRRTGWQILGGHEEGVGEHSFMTAVIAYFVAKQKSVNIETVLTMAIFHDFHEARTGEVDKIHTYYITRDQARANWDIFESLDTDLLHTLQQYEEKQSLEARICYEANIVAFLVEAKLLMERGHTHAEEWFDANTKRLRMEEMQQLAHTIKTTSSQAWWAGIRKDLNEKFIKE